MRSSGRDASSCDGDEHVAMDASIALSQNNVVLLAFMTAREE